MVDWSVAVPPFLTVLVEWVEAFTIVLAVGLSIGWRAALGASLAELAVGKLRGILVRHRLHPRGPRLGGSRPPRGRRLLRVGPEPARGLRPQPRGGLTRDMDPATVDPMDLIHRGSLKEVARAAFVVAALPITGAMAAD